MTPPAEPGAPLNDAQRQAAKEWAADDGLWTTQETVESSLVLFARAILAYSRPVAVPAEPGAPMLQERLIPAEMMVLEYLRARLKDAGTAELGAARERVQAETLGKALRILAALPVAVPAPVTPHAEIANIEGHIKALLPADYLASIGANVQAPNHKRERHHRCMRIFADLADRLAAVPSAVSPTVEQSGVELIAAERQRQIATEGWTPEHDDTHEEGELIAAAICYAAEAAPVDLEIRPQWPWPAPGKPSDPVRNLVKAGALIAA
jgi:hypothetical protein